MNRLWLLLLVSLGSAPMDRAAAEVVQTKGAASLEIHFDNEARALALADSFKVTLKVEGTPALRVDAPVELPADAAWTIVGRSEATRETIGPSRIRWQLVYQIAPREPGKAVRFAFPDVKYRDKDGDEQTVSWKPIPFFVITQIAKPDAAALRDITAIEETPPLAQADASWLLYAALIGLSLLLIGLALGVRTFLRRRPARTPVQIALYEWQRLLAMNLLEKERGERFITLLTTLLRRYLERQFALPARRQTTTEFLRSLEECTLLNAEEKQFVTKFFDRSDTVKFANDAATADECRQWAAETKHFLDCRARASTGA